MFEKILGIKTSSPDVKTNDHDTILNTAVYGVLFKLTDNVKLIKQNDYSYYKEQMKKTKYIQITNKYLYYPIAMYSMDAEEYADLQLFQGLIDGVDFVITNIESGMFLEHLEIKSSWINEVNFIKPKYNNL
jgi:hypothetical protein